MLPGTFSIWPWPQLLQSLVLNIWPGQSAPPFLGLGLVHSLLLVSTPGPQEPLGEWQGLQEFHSVQPPGSDVVGILSSSYQVIINPTELVNKAGKHTPKENSSISYLEEAHCK